MNKRGGADNMTIGLALFGLFVVLFALTFVVGLVYLAFD
jgi:hypothetical protein